MKREDILDTAKGHITKDRQATHGNPEDNFGAIAGAWNWWLEGRLTSPLTSHDVAMMMGLFKDARIRGNPAHRDSYEDGVVYRAIAGEIALRPAPPACLICGSTGPMPLQTYCDERLCETCATTPVEEVDSRIAKKRARQEGGAA